jgi:surfactin synthase thioesterase subunit
LKGCLLGATRFGGIAAGKGVSLIVKGAREMNLFCLPYAGGSAAVYTKWKGLLHPQIKLIPVELKGRGRRFNEPLYRDFAEAVADIYHQVKQEINGDDYILFGHSFGSILAYELYYKLVGENHRKPCHIFFSGQKAPHLQGEPIISSKLSEREFIAKIMALGGTPEEVLQNKSLLELVLPILKNDVKILENHRYRDRPTKLDCDVTVLHGRQDRLRLAAVEEWRKHSGRGYRLVVLDGGHFFINDHASSITALINHYALAVAASPF